MRKFLFLALHQGGFSRRGILVWTYNSAHMLVMI